VQGFDRVTRVSEGGADRAKASEIIHDLRNALGLIINYTSLVASELEDRPDVAEDVAEIRSAGRRAVELVGELSALIAARES
jgi:signal transduction histidine kinase